MANSNNLIIRLNETSVSMTEVFHFGQGKPSFGENQFFTFKSSGAEQKKAEFKESLTAFTANKSFDSITAYWNSNEQFIVPMKVFQASSLKDIGKLVLGDVDTNELDYNRLPEYDKVVVYRIPVWVKSALIVSFPLATIQAETSVFMRSILQNIKVKAQLHIKVSGSCASYFITGTGAKASDEILFSNHYTVENEDDLLYFSLNVLQNVESEINDVFVYLQKNNELSINQEVLQEKINKIKDLTSKNITYKSEEELINLFSICA